jgi:hypothetical protein
MNNTEVCLNEVDPDKICLGEKLNIVDNTLCGVSWCPLEKINTSKEERQTIFLGWNILYYHC